MGVMGNKQSRDRLSKEDIDFLTYHTKYTEDTIQEWYKGFKQDCPDGHLTKEFLLAIDVTSSGSPEQKLNWAFRMYDVDENGMIDLNEMTKLVRSIFKVSNQSQRTNESADSRAVNIFKKMDVNSDGIVTREEFVNACLADNSLMQML